MKKKKNFNLQHNKYVMYILLGVALINLLMFLQNNYLGSILLFFIVGLVSTLYTKNMNIILFSTILITNITVFVAKMFGYKEGLDMGGGGAKKRRVKPFKKQCYYEVDNDDDDDNFVGSRLEGFTSKGGAQSIETIMQNAVKEPMTGSANNAAGNTGANNAAGNTGANNAGRNAGANTGANNAGRNAGANNAGDSDDSDDDEGFKSLKEDIAETDKLTKSLRKNNISTDTEKEIKKLLNGTDIKNLNTNELIQQQKGLMDAMKNMDPLIKNVNEMIANLKNSPISSFMGLGK